MDLWRQTAFSRQEVCTCRPAVQERYESSTILRFIRLSSAMAARRTFELFLILVLVSGCICVDPCTDYDLMWMEYGRRSSDFNSENTMTAICDAYLRNDTWYRFEHDAGNRLIERPVEPWYCGAQAPIWLNGTHPTDTVQVTAEVCATFSSTNICGWSGTVGIQLCNESGSEFFVYLLAVPTGCPVAYCVDAATRIKCVPPLVWLQDEFKCGEQITTTTAAPTTSEPPSPGWSPWGPWSNCTKQCDYGLQTRRRTCGQLPCEGNATNQQSCALLNCEEITGEKDKGIVLSLESSDTSQDTMLKIVANQLKIDTVLRGNINGICSQNAELCCGAKLESISTFTVEYVTSSDIFAAAGFPKPKSEKTVYYKIIAIINEVVIENTCNAGSSRLRARQVQSSDPRFVPFQVMEMAARNSSSSILQQTGLAVTDYFNPVAIPDDSCSCPVNTCIIPIVVCLVVVIPVIAVVIVCLVIYMKKKSKISSTSVTRKINISAACADQIEKEKKSLPP